MRLQGEAGHPGWITSQRLAAPALLVRQGPPRRITLRSNRLPFPSRCPYPGDVPAGHGAGTAAARRGRCPGAAGASSVHSSIQPVAGLQAAAAQAGSPGSGAGSSLPAGKMPGKPWPRDPAASEAPAWREAAPKATGMHQGTCTPQRRGGRILLSSRQAWGLRLAGGIAGSGPEQSVQIEVGGKLMEMGEQLPCSSKAGRYQRAEL